MALLNRFVQKKKIDFFFNNIPKTSRILEIGCGNGWLSQYLKTNGWTNYTTLDLKPPADIVGDIRDWRNLGIEKYSFDTVIAFEVLEHVHCFQEISDILKPGGLLLVTTPVPHMDWVCKIMEAIGLNQPRYEPHDNLFYFKDIPVLEPVKCSTKYLIGQWGIFKNPDK